MPFEITIDGAGRLVIPQAVRRRLHLTAGSRLRLTEDGERLRLERAAGNATLAPRGRLLVLVAAEPGEVSDHRALREERAERIAPSRRSRT